MDNSEKQKAIVCVYMLFMQNDEVLMSRRINKSYMSEHYQIPTGHVENFKVDDKIIPEKPSTAVIRESREEVDAVVEEQDMELVLTQFKPSTDVPEPRVCLYYKINKWTGELVNKEPELADKFGFYPIKNLPTPMLPELAGAFKAIAEGRKQDEFGYSA